MAEKATLRDARRSRRKPAQERRQQLVREGVKSYLELGLGRAGHGDVARRAGVSTGTVFNYFPSRAALTDAVLDHVRETVFAIFEGFFRLEAQSDEAGSRVGTYLDAACRDHEPEVKLLLSWSRSFSPDIRPAYLDLQRDILSRANGQMQGRAQAAVDTRILLSWSLVYMQMAFDGTQDAAMSRVVQRISDVFD